MVSEKLTFFAVPPNAYWSPDTAANHFIEVGQEEPPPEH
jgi:hypothetical protein